MENNQFSYSNFPSWSRKRPKRHAIISFILQGSEAGEEYFTEIGATVLLAKEKTLSSCFPTKSFDNKKIYTGKAIPKERSFAHLLVVGSKKYKEAVNNFQSWVKTRISVLKVYT